MKKFIYTGFLSLFVVFNIYSQAQKWEGELSIGVSNYLGDLVEKKVAPSLNESNLALGLKFNYSLSKTIGLQFGGNYARFSGSDLNFSDPEYHQRAFEFSSNILELGARLKWEPLGNDRYDHKNHFQKIISPYLFVGAGLGILNAKPDFSKTQLTNTAAMNADLKAMEKSNINFVTPIGGGLRIDLNNSTALDFELSLYTPYSDYIDGISEAANPEKKDWYYIASIGIAKKIGKKDTDGDGIIDEEDACPQVPGDLTAKGCPDSDGDTVEDSEDICPFLKGKVELNGCPDKDGDGLADIQDECPEVKGTVNGCPDKDGDGVKDSEDKCPEIAGGINTKGCPDKDGDGIFDSADNCPEVAGKAEFAGCPYLDSDKDGVPDDADDCPTVYGKMKGCPDRDDDGVMDKDDKCPTVVGPASNNGCPEIQKEEQEQIDFAISGVKFETASAVIKKSSYTTLDNIVDIMKKYPYYSLRISGYTDSRGHADANLKLSQNRAKSCLDYLVSKGIDKSRLESNGYGEAKPIGDNKTAAGRQKNRRVTFDLFLK